MLVLRDSEDPEDLEKSRSLKLPVDRNFPALLRRSNEDGVNFKIYFEVLKQEVEYIGLQGLHCYWFIGFTLVYIAEYITIQQTLDIEERAALTVAQRFHAGEKKRADEIRMAEIQAEAEEKERADEL